VLDNSIPSTKLLISTCSLKLLKLMEKSKMKAIITQKDIGKRCGVSAACVGYILSGSTKYKFRPETIEKVLRAADELHYRPNYQAACLRKKNNNLLICIVGCACRYSDSLHLKYLAQEAEKAGFQLLVQFIVGLSDEKKIQFIRNIINVPAGILIWSLGFQNPDNLKNLVPILRKAPPTLHLSHPLPGTKADYISILWGGRSLPELLNYFAGRKIRKVRCCVGPVEKKFPNIRNFARLARKVNIIGKVYAASDDIRDYYQTGRIIADEILNEKDLPDALYSVSDEITLVLMDAFRRRGIRVPNDILIISGGDSDFLQWLTNPPPALIHDIPLLAKSAIRNITDRIQEGCQDTGTNACVLEIPQKLLFPDGTVYPLISEPESAQKMVKD